MLAEAFAFGARKWQRIVEDLLDRPVGTGSARMGAVRYVFDWENTVNAVVEKAAEETGTRFVDT